MPGMADDIDTEPAHDPVLERVLVLGATGTLGRHLVAEFARRGHPVRMIARPGTRLPDECRAASEVIRGEMTRPESLAHAFQNVTTVVSALGLTRQRDGLGPWDVDYWGNRYALDLAVARGARRFAYVHVLNADKLAGVPLVDAKSAFVRDLQAAPLAATVICPSGFFSDAEEILTMARRGLVPLMGGGQAKVSFIDTRDLAPVIADAVADGASWIDVGGPETLTTREAALLAFDAVGRRPRLLPLPVWLVRAVVAVVGWVAPPSVSGPLRFFARVSREDMDAPPHGHRRLGDHFKALVAAEADGTTA